MSYAGLKIKWGHTVSGSVTIAAEANVTDVNASAATYTRDADSWLDDGFEVGDEVFFAGFLNEGNNGPKVITALSATVMTVRTNWNDLALVNEVDVNCTCVEKSGAGGGAPSWTDIYASIEDLCASTGGDYATVKELVVDWSENGGTLETADPAMAVDAHPEGGHPSGAELHAVLKTLRAAAGDSSADYLISFGAIDGLDGGTIGYPGPEELKALLFSIFASK